MLTEYRLFFFFTNPEPTAIYTLSLHDALPIFTGPNRSFGPAAGIDPVVEQFRAIGAPRGVWIGVDRKSTRLNSSHVRISYAVFCLKKKKKKHIRRSIIVIEQTSSH